jgi:hypothetical protein
VVLPAVADDVLLQARLPLQTLQDLRPHPVPARLHLLPLLLALQVVVLPLLVQMQRLLA